MYLKDVDYLNTYKGVIFDLDGTLLNSLEDIGDSMNKALDHMKFPIFNYDEYKLKVGGGFKNLLINYLPEGTSEELSEETLALFLEAYGKNYSNKTKPYDGIIELLNELKARGIKLGVNSNKRDDYTNYLVNKHFSDIPFVKTFGDRQGIVRKPDPSSALEIARAMDLRVEQVLFIGDSSIDMITAKNANMDSVGVLWGFRGREELKSNGANYLVEKPSEIIDIIGKEKDKKLK